jgi:hypothetical protein
MEGSGLGLIDILSWHLPGGTEENHEKICSVHKLLLRVS